MKVIFPLPTTGGFHEDHMTQDVKELCQLQSIIIIRYPRAKGKLGLGVL